MVIVGVDAHGGGWVNGEESGGDCGGAYECEGEVDLKGRGCG